MTSELCCVTRVQQSVFHGATVGSRSLLELCFHLITDIVWDSGGIATEVTVLGFNCVFSTVTHEVILAPLIPTNPQSAPQRHSSSSFSSIFLCFCDFVPYIIKVINVFQEYRFEITSSLR